ncbi:MAG: aldo/keto reductase [Verrucomicrobiales bacterium]
MTSNTKTIQGVDVPALGLGTYELSGEVCREAIVTAIETGYRHVDTARAYENEEDVGAGLAESGIERDQIFLTSKVWFEDLNFTSVLTEVNASLKALQTDYLDLALIHWPNREIPLQDTFAALQRLRDDGLILQFGVSNFTPRWLKAALDITPLFCNQVEFHPLLRRDELNRMAVENDMLLTAYSPLAQGKIRGCDALEAIARKHGKTPEQISLRWLLDHPNVAAIPRSSNPEHISDNFQVWDFELDQDDNAAIAALPNGQRQIDPEFAPAWEV